jgi:intracellular sulfur oxidation DsrE/DsrF family protein
LKLDRAALMEEFKANLLPGVILQPNGIYATMRAQQAGCVYIRAG